MRVVSSPATVTDPAVGRLIRTSVRAMVLFPEPDSPASPSVSPVAMVNDTPSTAFTVWAALRALRDRK